MSSKVCTHCKLKALCEGLPGFCLMLPYLSIAAVVFLLIYFITNSTI